MGELLPQVAAGELDWASGNGAGNPAAWGRLALPAVVNPVVRSPLQSVLSLRGEWEFVTQGVAHSKGHGLSGTSRMASGPRPSHAFLTTIYRLAGLSRQISDTSVDSLLPCLRDVHAVRRLRMYPPRPHAARPSNAIVAGSGMSSPMSWFAAFPVPPLYNSVT